MEQLIANLLEKSLVGGAFVYLLWMNTTSHAKALDKLSSTMTDISDTMKHMNSRMESVEQRMERIENNRGN